MGLHGLLGDSFTLLYADNVVPHRKHTYGPPRPVRGISLLFYMQMMFVLHRKYTYGSLRPVTEVALLYFTPIYIMYVIFQEMSTRSIK
jgi:hypothetical protein